MRFDVFEEPPQGGPVQIPAAEAAIIVPVGNQLPAGLLLARNIGFGRLALRVKGIELLIEPFLGRFPRVDGAADDGRTLSPPFLGVDAVTHGAAPRVRRTTGHSSGCR